MVHRLFGPCVVAAWCRPHHWQVPVNFPGNEYAIVALDDLSPVEAA